MGLWLEHHTASLSVSNQPLDVYYIRAWAPWGKTWRVTARCSLPWWKWSSPWTWSDATEAVQAECKTPGWVASESLQGLDALTFPLLASQDGSHSLLPSVHLKPNTSSHRPVRTSSDQSTTMSPILARSWGAWGTGVTAGPWHGIPGVCGLYSKVVMPEATWPSRCIQELGPDAWSSGLDCCCQGQCSCQSRWSIQVCAPVQRPHLLGFCPASGRPAPPITLKHPPIYFPHKPDYF